MALAEFFHMGGYAFYVWTSYGVALVVLAVTVIAPLYRHRLLLRAIHRRRRRTGHRP